MPKQSVPDSAAAVAELPPVQAGNHLDQKTFHQRYEATCEDFRDELVGGLVIVPSPPSTDHGDCHALVVGWLTAYRAATPGTRVLAGATILLGPSSEPQPDACLLIDPDCGGRTHRQGDYTAGPPELVVEVASSREAYGLYEKYRDYEQAGVLEYLVVLLRERRVEWFVARAGRFQPLQAEAGLFRSTVFPGLWSDDEALIRGDAAKLLETVQQGTRTPGYAAFVQRLRSESTKSK